METRWAGVGAAVRAARAAQNLTQDDLAVRVGVSTGTIRAIERGTEFTKVTFTLRAVERALGWAPGSIEAVLDGGEPIPADIEVARASAPAASVEGLPLRVVQALTEGTALDTRVVPLTPDADMVVLIMGKPAAGPAEIRAALEAWERREGHLDRRDEVSDDSSESS